MLLKLQKKIDLANLLRLSKQNKLHINILLFSSLFLPISIIAGPLILEILIFLIFVSYLYLIISTNKIKINFSNLDILIFYFFLVLIFSSLLSDHKLISLKSSFFSLRFIIYYYAIFFLLKKLNYFLKYFFIISAACLLFVIFDAYIQFFFGKDIFLLERLGGTIVTGIFGDEKKLGSFIVRFSPLVIGSYLIIAKQNLKKKTFNLLILFSLTSLLILLSSERIAVIYFCTTLFFFIIYLKKNKLAMNKIFSFIFSIFVISTILITCMIKFEIYPIADTYKNTLKQISPDGKIIFFSNQHSDFAFTSIVLFKKNIIFGIGPNNFRRQCSNVDLNKIKKEFKKEEINNCSTHPHNIFFQILSETGIVGTIFYLVVFICLLKEALFFLIKSNIKHAKIFFILPLIYYFNPFLPSGNFFNNWYMFIGLMGLPFYLFLSKIKKSV